MPFAGEAAFDSIRYLIYKPRGIKSTIRYKASRPFFFPANLEDCTLKLPDKGKILEVISKTQTPGITQHT